MSEREQFEAWRKANPVDLDTTWWNPESIAWHAWQAARAQPAQAVPLLTDAAIRQIADACDDGQEDAEYTLAFARAIEQAVRAKMGVAVPMTDDASKLRSLLGAALGALRYHTEQTRPIQRTKETIQAIEYELGGIVGKGGA